MVDNFVSFKYIQKNKENIQSFLPISKLSVKTWVNIFCWILTVRLQNQVIELQFEMLCKKPRRRHTIDEEMANVTLTGKVIKENDYTIYYAFP